MKPLAPELTVTIPIEVDGTLDRPELGFSLYGADATDEQKALGAVEGQAVSLMVKALKPVIDIQAIEQDLGFTTKGD